MDAIRKYVGIGTVEGVVEIDDTYFRKNFRDKHTENSVFKRPRKLYKLGVKQDTSKVKISKKRKRCLSNEKISVMFAIDRSDNLITEEISRGNVGYETIFNLFVNRKDSETITCVDFAKGFTKFARTSEIDVVQLEKDKK
ncbi:MAG: hypothetical protein KIA08_00320 [Clostridium baratii]|uniref:hypothetical protein n=1 Tax=Clostridium baratii TaxID=1561 RepID=UPI00243323DA|nr:hypothetical protein [Clostridium baratii]MBS6041117.1 hypothetical protein [Clostridium baratii]